jgi:hypothetical protein
MLTVILVMVHTNTTSTSPDGFLYRGCAIECAWKNRITLSFEVPSFFRSSLLASVSSVCDVIYLYAKLWFVGLARTIYLYNLCIRCIFGIFGRKITKRFTRRIYTDTENPYTVLANPNNTVIYGAYMRFLPTLVIAMFSLPDVDILFRLHPDWL